MGNFDNGTRGDDPDSQPFGDSEFDAFAGCEVDVEEQCLVAGFAQNADAQVVDGGGEVMRYGLEC